MIAKIKDLLKFSIAFLFSLFYRKKNIWIITERRGEAKDNGYHLFKYIRTAHPEINAYYAINKGAQQREKIEPYGNIIEFNSFKHYTYALAAKYLVGAFLPCGIPDSMCFYKFGGMVKGKKIFLQHGITKEEIETLKYDRTKADIFICGAKPEYDFICEKFGYPNSNVKYTGFARYDALNDHSVKRQILLMPTWRQYLNSQTWGGDKESFINTEYYNVFNSFINDPHLHTLLAESGVELIFYPHHEVQGNIDVFSTSSHQIVIDRESEYDVQSLLKESALLITDYSSVAFDFAYMRKPIIYYQFDEETYYDKHYKKGYFDYAAMGFGTVCKDGTSLIMQIEDVLKNNFASEDKYAQRVDEFFKMRDSDNCKRIFEEIIKL